MDKDLQLNPYTEADSVYFGMDDHQASYKLDLFYQDKYITSQTYTDPFTLYFNEIPEPEVDGDAVYLDSKVDGDFYYKMTSTSASASYIFKEWQIKHENALNNHIDIKPIYVSSEGPQPDPGTGGSSEGAAQTGDENFILIAILIGVIILACGAILMGYFVKRKNNKPKHTAKHK